MGRTVNFVSRPADAQSESDKKREQEIMDELVVLVNKRDEIIASIELERERAASREATPQKPSTSTPEPVKGIFIFRLFF